MTLWERMGAVRFVDAGVAEDDRKEANGVDYSLSSA
jgi:hypothetical protein